MIGPDAMILVFCMLSFKPVFSLSSRGSHQEALSSSLSAFRVVSYAYLRLLIFLPTILIPACDLIFPSKNFTQFVVIHTVKGFGIVNEAEEAVSLEFLCFLHDPAYVDNLMSGSSSISKPNLHVWKFLVHRSHTAES